MAKSPRIGGARRVFYPVFRRQELPASYWYTTPLRGSAPGPQFVVGDSRGPRDTPHRGPTGFTSAHCRSDLRWATLHSPRCGSCFTRGAAPTLSLPLSPGSRETHLRGGPTC